MKELQELRNEILTLRNYGVINKEEEKTLLNKLNAIKEQLTLTDVSVSFLYDFVNEFTDTEISKQAVKETLNQLNERQRISVWCVAT